MGCIENVRDDEKRESCGVLASAASSDQAKKHCKCSAFRLVGDGGFVTTSSPNGSVARTAKVRAEGKVAWFLRRRPHPTIRSSKKALQVQCSLLGGGWWIRTTEVSDNRFTVCPLWPLGKSPIIGAGERSRTINRLITNQVLCH